MKKLLILSILLILGCATAPEDVHGCFDSQACNYELSATIDNNSCTYPDINEACCLPTEVDCSGICYGEDELDECGICGGVDFVDCMDAIVFRTDFNSLQDLGNFNYNSSHFQSIQISDSLLEFVGSADDYQHLMADSLTARLEIDVTVPPHCPRVTACVVQQLVPPPAHFAAHTILTKFTTNYTTYTSDTLGF